MSEEDALSKVQKYLHRQGIDRLSPIARKVEREGTPNRRNVVLVFMESMSANLMGTFGSDKKLTPYLDSLYQQSLSFSHFYSSGFIPIMVFIPRFILSGYHETECHERFCDSCLFGTAYRIAGERIL